MCFFEQVVWECGYWRWGSFRHQCNKEYRIGETCGMKLIDDTNYQKEPCKLCISIQKKARRIRKMENDLERWHLEGDRPATIERTQQDKAQMEHEINCLLKQHETYLAPRAPRAGSEANACDNLPHELPVLREMLNFV